MLPSADLSHLPAPARASIDASRDAFIREDRGSVRRGNDHSHDSRLRHFACWLDRLCYDQQSLARLTPEQEPDVLGAFLADLRKGYTLQGSAALTATTLRNYLTSARTGLSLLRQDLSPFFSLPSVSVSLPSSAVSSPYLREQLATRANWSRPTPLKEPYTLAMLVALQKVVSDMSPLAHAHLGVEAAALDWLVLILFTGSRLAEYFQTRLKKGVRFNTIPSITDAGPWGGMPLAFIRADFVFFDRAHCLASPTSLATLFADGQLLAVHVRFRFDKSKKNFTIRIFHTTGHSLLDAVAAAVSIFARAKALGIPEHEPIGAFWSPRLSSFTFLRDYHIRNALRSGCLLAYPGPLHYLRLHITRLLPHSGRVTAALCLALGGASVDTIAHKLRWQRASVPTYLRKCWQDVGPLMLTILQGAYHTS